MCLLCIYAAVPGRAMEIAGYISFGFFFKKIWLIFSSKPCNSPVGQLKRSTFSLLLCTLCEYQKQSFSNGEKLFLCAAPYFPYRKRNVNTVTSFSGVFLPTRRQRPRPSLRSSFSEPSFSAENFGLFRWVGFGQFFLISCVGKNERVFFLIFTFILAKSPSFLSLGPLEARITRTK